MTLKDIKAQFSVGQVWKATREGVKPFTVVGNLGTTVLPANNNTELRTVTKVGSVDLVWSRPGSDRNIFTKWPKASEIIESRMGFLKFAYDNGIVVTLERVPEMAKV